MVVSFFGHRDCPVSVYPKLLKIIESLVLQNENATFLLGDRGSFDNLALNAVKEIKNKYLNLEYFVVLAYYKENRVEEPSLYPEEVAMSIPKFAINVRNRWIVEKSDVVITYVCRNWGGAYFSKRLAGRKKKRIIELFEDENSIK